MKNSYNQFSKVIQELSEISKRNNLCIITATQLQNPNKPKCPASKIVKLFPIDHIDKLFKKD